MQADTRRTSGLAHDPNAVPPAPLLPTEREAAAPQPPQPAKRKRGLSRRHRLSPLVADAKRLARLLGLSLRTVRSMDAAGKLPRPVKLGARTMWVLREIREWLAAGAPERGPWEALKAAQSRGRGR
jgi:predicted DNA-binding transcriptional regulator AlpA